MLENLTTGLDPKLMKALSAEGPSIKGERRTEAEARLKALDPELHGIITEMFQEQLGRAFTSEFLASCATDRAEKAEAIADTRAQTLLETYEQRDSALARLAHWMTRAAIAEERLTRKDAPLARAIRRR